MPDERDITGLLDQNQGLADTGAWGFAGRLYLTWSANG